MHKNQKNLKRNLFVQCLSSNWITSLFVNVHSVWLHHNYWKYNQMLRILSHLPLLYVLFCVPAVVSGFSALHHISNARIPSNRAFASTIIYLGRSWRNRFAFRARYLVKFNSCVSFHTSLKLKAQSITSLDFGAQHFTTMELKTEIHWSSNNSDTLKSSP